MVGHKPYSDAENPQHRQTIANNGKHYQDGVGQRDQVPRIRKDAEPHRKRKTHQLGTSDTLFITETRQTMSARTVIVPELHRMRSKRRAGSKPRQLLLHNSNKPKHPKNAIKKTQQKTKEKTPHGLKERQASNHKTEQTNATVIPPGNMNEFYDSAKAMHKLQELTAERQANDQTGNQLSGMSKLDYWTSNFVALETHAATWHLARAKPGHETTEEAIFRLQGILCMHDLPPFLQPLSSRRKDKIRYLRQSIVLSSLGTPLFDACIENMTQGYGILARNMPSSHLAPHGIVDTLDGTPSLNLANRYFTPKRDTPRAKTIPFTCEIDPLGILTAAAGETYIHMEENIINYYKRTTDSDGEFRYTNLDPAQYRQGDIVEVEACLTLVPIKNNKYKLLAVLRSITLLDATHSQNAITKDLLNRSAALAPRQTTQTIKLKRTNRYQQEEMTAARAKMQRMTIEQADNQVEPAWTTHTKRSKGPRKP